MTEEEVLAKCARIKHVALDMDGTIYMGSSIFPFTLEFFELLKKLGISWSYLTNNPTKNPSDYIRKLTGMGIEADESQMLTSASATIAYLHRNLPEVKRLFTLGTPSMQQQFRQAGFEITADDPADRPDALVVAFDTTLEYSRFCRAAWWASKPEIPYIATNPDWVCPTDEQTILIDCGSLCKALEGATGRKPDVVIGKPNPGMLYSLRDSLGLQSDEIAVCGDRIYTDVAAARNAGCLGVLVLSGETTRETAMSSSVPDIVTENILEFGKTLLKAKQ